MASLNTSTNGPSIKSSYLSIVNSPPPTGPASKSATYGCWSIFTVSAPLVNAFQPDAGGKESVLKVQSTEEGELLDLIEDLSEGRVQFAFVKLKDPNTTLPKFVLIGWCGEGVPERTKGYFTSHMAAVGKILHGYHVQITARSDRDLTPESILKKVADASGAKYTAESSSPAASRPVAPLSAKPAFNPTRSTGSSGFNPLGNRTRPGYNDQNVDADGWGTDAPQTTRTQLEKVSSAYQPTKVNMAELTKQRQESSYVPPAPVQSGADVVKGGYQPIGKVDIAALRGQAKQADDRPVVVKGAYEPVGKVDIAAIRARAQKPNDEGPRQSRDSDSGGVSGGVADRASAFSQSERLTTLPKPKVGNKFGSSAGNFAGTKAPAPGGYGLQSAPPTAGAAPVGAASRTFADQGGKTPAQIWAEKKARERGTSNAGDTNLAPSAAPMTAQQSGGGEWKSGYSGKSWAPVGTNPTGRSNASSIPQQRTGDQQQDQDQEEDQEQEVPSSPAGGIGALRDRFAGGTPMGAPASTRDASPPPPPIPSASRPVEGVAMPGLPTRSRPEADDNAGPNIPPPPPVQRSPSPPSDRETSPVRVAIPVSRGRDPHIDAPAERHAEPAVPVHSLEKVVPDEDDLTSSPAGHDPARAAGAAVAAASFGASAAAAAPGAQGGKRALILYDYEKAEDNEVELAEGEHVTNIDMVDPDWWMGTNSKGESGLFPSNYVELVEDGDQGEANHGAPEATSDDHAAAGAPSHAAEDDGPHATAQYDYEAAEDNELSFPENATITQLEFPDEDWWFGHYDGKAGLFPANYVQLVE